MTVLEFIILIFAVAFFFVGILVVFKIVSRYPYSFSRHKLGRFLH